MKVHPLFLFCLCCFFGNAQNIKVSQMEASKIKKIEFNIDVVNNLKLSTHKHKYISLKTTTEGEYQNDIFLWNKANETTFYVNSNFDAKLENGFDKLSAMKVFSVEIEVIVPENLSISIESSTANLTATGLYYKINAALKTGNIQLQNFEGNAYLYTYTGNVSAVARDVKVEASSRNGKVSIDGFLLERYFMKITSIDGNIKVVSF